MKKYLLMVLPALLALFTSCSIKEDRSECPCYLELVADSRMEQLPEQRFLLSVFNGSNTAFREVFSVGWLDGSEYPTIQLRRGYVDVNALWGAFHGVVSGYRYIIPEGMQMDSLYSCTSRRVDATGELAVASIFDAKQFCTIDIKLVPEELESPFSLLMRGNVCGVDLRNLEPSHGKFRTLVREYAPSRFSVRVPRQYDASLSLDFLLDGAVVSSFDLGARIQQMGYDWKAESLEDIQIEIDYANARISINVGGWEMSWAYSIEI